MADAMEPRWQDMGQKPANELAGREMHDLKAIGGLDPVVFPSEGDRLGVGADQARVWDGHPVSVPAQIGQNRLGPAEWRFGVDYPGNLAKRGETGLEAIRIG